MAEEIDNVDVETTETDTAEETSQEETQPEQTEKPAKQQETPEAKLARLERQAAQMRKKLGLEPEKKADEPSSKAGELDLSALSYLRSALNIKGQAEIGLVKEYIKAGKSVLDLEDNRHFMNDLQDLRDTAAAKAATPTSKRSGPGGGNDFELAYSKYEQTGELPKDFELRSKVIETKVAKASDNTPPWRRG